MDVRRQATEQQFVCWNLIEAWGPAPSTPQVVLHRDVLLSAAYWSGIIFQIKQRKINEGLDVCCRLFAIHSIIVFWTFSFPPRPLDNFWISLKEFENLFSVAKSQI